MKYFFSSLINIYNCFINSNKLLKSIVCSNDWLDDNIDKISNDDYRRTMNQLKRIVHSINRFDNIKECIHFLTQIKVFLIASDNIGQQIMLRIHHMSQLDSVFVISRNRSTNNYWTN
jgi:hypothetical protein